FDLLHNEDLAVITSFGLFIWSTWQKDEKIRKIQVLYYMSYGDHNTYLEYKQSYTSDDQLLLKELLDNLLD
ncbi:18019_t:CDS:2, partial [Racocetra persica]